MSEIIVGFRKAQILESEAIILQDFERKFNGIFVLIDELVIDDLWHGFPLEIKVRNHHVELIVINLVNSGETIDYELVDSLKGLKHLRVIYLICDKENGIQQIPESLAELVDIEELTIMGGRLTELPDYLVHLKKLKYLDLSGNNITKISKAIGLFESLTTLLLQKNVLEYTPDTIGNLKSLKILDLSNNKLKKLPESLGNLVSLEKLNLEYNLLNFLPESIGQLKNLYHLNLSRNILHDLPKSIESMNPDLKLIISDLKIDGNKRLEEWLRNFRSLKENQNTLFRVMASIQKKEDDVKIKTKIISKSGDYERKDVLIKYPPMEVYMQTGIERPNIEHVILWMLFHNEVCKWEDFKNEPLNIPQSTLSFYLKSLMLDDYIEKKERGVYQITPKGKERYKIIFKIKKERKINYPPELIMETENYEDIILWMAYNNTFYKWSDFIDKPLKINQSILSKELNILLRRGLVSKENKQYKITSIGKSEYLRLQHKYSNLDLYVVYRGDKIYTDFDTSSQEIYIDLNQIGIKKISEVEGLDKLTKVTNVYLFGNSIEKIEGLEGLKHIKKLDLEYNMIHEIEGLETLSNLRELNLKMNQITEIKGLENLEKLEILNLEYNKITNISGLEKLKNLQVLRLGGNQINEIKGLENLIHLKWLSFCESHDGIGNHIREIKGIENLGNLERLDLGNNKIVELKGLDSLNNLKKLYINDNLISEIKNLDKLRDLEELSLYDNKIEYIFGLDNLVYLKILNLDGNKIKAIETLENLKNIKILNLNNNKIKKISGISTLVNLEYLDLSDNLILEIKGFENLKKIKSLILDDNQIIQLTDIEKFKTFDHISLQRNPIPKSELEKLKKIKNSKI